MGFDIGYKTGRNLSKIILVATAIAISSFANWKYISDVLNFDIFGLAMRNIIALSIVFLGFMMKGNNILTPPILPILKDRAISKIVYYFGLGIIALAVSTFRLFSGIISMPILDMEFITIGNIIAVILLLSAKTINDTG